jgi:hypothetical protein
MHTCCLHDTKTSAACSKLRQAIIAALRQLESALAASRAPKNSFSSQALQGLLLKALVPLIHPATLPATTAAAATPAGAAAAAACVAPQEDLLSGFSNSAASRLRTLGHQQLLRLLQLPAQYDPQQLPQGSQVLPLPPRAAAAAVAPVHQAVEKDGVRLQASGEALFAGDVAAQMRGRVLYLAGEFLLWFTKR